jgi:predicted RNase H-like nuclease (RuvC/YqgF family)
MDARVFDRIAEEIAQMKADNDRFGEEVRRVAEDIAQIQAEHHKITADFEHRKCSTTEVPAVTRIAADLQRKAGRIAKEIAEMEAKLDKANADIEHRKVDLLQLQSEGGSDAKCEDVEDSIEDKQRNARFLRKKLTALEHKQVRINLDLRQAEDALQQHTRADDMTAALDMEADHLHVRALSVAEERERVRGDLEHARCEALRLQSEASDHDAETFEQR